MLDAPGGLSSPDLKVPKITFQSVGVSGEVEGGISLLEAAFQLGVDLNHVCGGSAACSTCRVEVLNGLSALTEIGSDERDRMGLEFLEPPYRLACQARILGDVVVRIPDE